jgi:polyisoprenoid-binding protein YceI
VPVTLNGATASGSFAIKRLAFDIGSGEWADTSMVADEVQVRFKLQLAGLPK